MPKFEVYFEQASEVLSPARIQQIGEIVLQGEACQWGGRLILILVDNDRIQELNARFLNINRPTDVLAFPLDDKDDDVWGEIYISEEQARSQALTYDVPLEEELSRLVIHGLLHLLGFEDEDLHSKKQMTEREDVYLKRIFYKHKKKGGNNNFGY